MSKLISTKALKISLANLKEWKAQNDNQGVKHLIHVLAAKERGASEDTWIEYTEQMVDFKFCDSYLRVNNSLKPYYDPFDGDYRIHSHPHSNIATARKKTFVQGWGAGEFKEEDGKVFFKFREKYQEVLTEKMKKAGVYKKISAIDLAIFLFRRATFEDDDSILECISRLKRVFNFTDAEWNTIFELSPGSEYASISQWTSRSTNEHSLLTNILLHDPANFDYLLTLKTIREKSISIMEKTKQIAQDIKEKGFKQIILQGPPGTGKTFLAKKIADTITDGPERIKFVQFHPTYDYDSFIQRLIPVKDKTTGEIKFCAEDQLFIATCNEAAKEPESRYVLIIDEINRADLNRVFGELLYALEYRNSEVNLQYGGNAFLVPSNLIVIGTMNTADSSVAHIDYAFRRRFVFYDINPSKAIIEQDQKDDLAIKTGCALFEKTNQLLENHPRFRIGHTYFMGASLQEVVDSYVYRVLPLIRAYQDNGVLPGDLEINLPSWQSNEKINPGNSNDSILSEELLEWGKRLNE